jgi:hypothetical protein
MLLTTIGQEGDTGGGGGGGGGMVDIHSLTIFFELFNIVHENDLSKK